jgi:hypothetical protein
LPISLATLVSEQSPCLSYSIKELERLLTRRPVTIRTSTPDPYSSPVDEGEQEAEVVRGILVSQYDLEVGSKHLVSVLTSTPVVPHVTLTVVPVMDKTSRPQDVAPIRIRAVGTPITPEPIYLYVSSTIQLIPEVPRV